MFRSDNRPTVRYLDPHRVTLDVLTVDGSPCVLSAHVEGDPLVGDLWVVKCEIAGIPAFSAYLRRAWGTQWAEFYGVRNLGPVCPDVEDLADLAAFLDSALDVG